MIYQDQHNCKSNKRKLIICLCMGEEQVGIIDRDGGVLLVELQSPLVSRLGIVDVLQVRQGDCKMMKRRSLNINRKLISTTH